MIKPWQERRDTHEHISGPISAKARHELMQAEIDDLRKENKVLRDAWSAEPVAWIKYGNGITNLTTNAGIAERDKYDTPLYTRKQS
jgi:hypothetical protein